MQQLIITGNVGQQAVVRQAANGQAIGFSVAVNENYKGKDGQRQEKTTWFKCTYWMPLGASTSVAEYLKPGQPVSIIGTPYAEAYLKDGKPVAEQCVRVRRLELIGSPKGAPANASQIPDTDRVQLDDDDNDLPF